MNAFIESAHKSYWFWTHSYCILFSLQSNVFMDQKQVLNVKLLSGFYIK